VILFVSLPDSSADNAALFRPPVMPGHFPAWKSAAFSDTTAQRKHHYFYFIIHNLFSKQEQTRQ